MDFSYSEDGWKTAWRDKTFRIKTVIAFASICIIFTFFPFFLQYIEYRPGIKLNDWLLSRLSPHNVSLIIFICIWITVLLAIVRAVQRPYFFLVTLYSYCVICIFRYITLTLVPLEAPTGLIPLIDPLSNLFYGKKFITKDLFFSRAHIRVVVDSILFLAKKDKYFALLTGTIVGILVLVQHVHYTIDVISSPFFSLMAYKMGKKLAYLQ